MITVSNVARARVAGGARMPVVGGQSVEGLNLLQAASGFDLVVQFSNQVAADRLVSGLQLTGATVWLAALEQWVLRRDFGNSPPANPKLAAEIAGDYQDPLAVVPGLDVDELVFDGARSRLRLTGTLVLTLHSVRFNNPKLGVGKPHPVLPGEAQERRAGDPVEQIQIASRVLVPAQLATPGQELLDEHWPPSLNGAAGPATADRTAWLGQFAAAPDRLPEGVPMIGASLGSLGSLSFTLECAYATWLGTNADGGTVAILRDAAVSLSEPQGDAAVICSADDPVGLLAKIVAQIRRRGEADLVPPVSLVGAEDGDASAYNAKSADGFPTGAETTNAASSFNIGLTVNPGAAPVARTVPHYLGDADWGVIGSIDTARDLIRHRWDRQQFPRQIGTAVPIKMDFGNGPEDVTENAWVLLDTLDQVSFETSSGTGVDVLYMAGTAHLRPISVTRKNGATVVPKDPNDPLWASGDPEPWSAVGVFVVDLGSSAPEFERLFTNGVSRHLGRPFAEYIDGDVIYARLSAPGQRYACLGNF